LGLANCREDQVGDGVGLGHRDGVRYADLDRLWSSSSAANPPFGDLLSPAT
jgi:hypothetical protein